MNRTIMTLIGLIIAVIAIGIAIYKVTQTLGA